MFKPIHSIWVFLLLRSSIAGATSNETEIRSTFSNGNSNSHRQRIWVQYEQGTHDSLVHDILRAVAGAYADNDSLDVPSAAPISILGQDTIPPKESSTAVIELDVPEISSLVVSVDTEEEIDAITNLPGVTLVSPDPKRYPMHMPVTEANLKKNYDDQSNLLLPPSASRKKTSSGNLRNLQFDDQGTPYGIVMTQAESVWEEFGVDGSGVTVCVIDSGFDSGHEDFNDDLFTGDSLARRDGWDNDVNGHGTHCAGIVGAANNDVGVVGIAPGANIHTVKVFSDRDGGYVYASALVDAAYKCRDAGAKIISMSLGGPLFMRQEAQLFETFWEDYGIISVSASGNSGYARLKLSS